MVPATEPAIMQSVVRPARELLAVLLFVGVTVSMARRWRAAPPFRRRVMGPVMLASGASVILLTAFFVARRESPDSNATTTLGVLWSLCIPAMAGAFFVGLLQRRLLLGQVLAPLGTLLSDQADTRQLRDAIASALDDPQLEVLVPDTPGHWRDSRGRVGDPATASAGGRNVTMIGDHGTPGIVVVHDRQLAAGDEIVRAVGALALAGLRNERMNARLTASLAELETSRRRIAHAADRERARIERDLHDGAQQHLIALRVRLSLVEDMLRRHPGADAGAGAAAMVELGFEVDRTLDELRSLAHGVYPSMLRDRGLADALRGVAAHAPLPVRVQALGLTRHPPEIDTAVYFTCLEALQNAIKHAPGAKSVRITLRENSVLALEVRDDGPGFESGVAEACSGAGLRNMRDRIEAVGGRLTIESAPGQGTRILAWVPLG